MAVCKFSKKVTKMISERIFLKRASLVTFRTATQRAKLSDQR